MRPHLAAAARVLVPATVALGVVIALAPGRLELAVRIYAIVLAAMVASLAIARVRMSYPRTTPFRPGARTWKRKRGRRNQPRPASLSRIEQEVALGASSAFDLHHRLRPRLRLIARELLETRRGIVLDTEPGRARSALGDTAWELVRPDRPPPEDRQATGLPLADLRAVVERLERA